MKKIMAVLFVSALGLTVRATPQAPDRLIIGKDTVWDCYLPYIPHEGKDLFPSGPIEILSTGCYRGYIATWKIEDGRLYLLRMDREPRHPTAANQVDMKCLFGEKCRDGKVFADWVTGRFYAQSGKIVGCRMGFDEDIREWEREIYVTDGMVFLGPSYKTYERHSGKLSSQDERLGYETLHRLFANSFVWPADAVTDVDEFYIFTGVSMNAEGKSIVYTSNKPHCDDECGLYIEQEIRRIFSLVEWDVAINYGEPVTVSYLIIYRFVPHTREIYCRATGSGKFILIRSDSAQSETRQRN